MLASIAHPLRIPRPEIVVHRGNVAEGATMEDDGNEEALFCTASNANTTNETNAVIAMTIAIALTRNPPPSLPWLPPVPWSLSSRAAIGDGRSHAGRRDLMPGLASVMAALKLWSLPKGEKRVR